MMKETIKKSYQKILYICERNLFSTLNYIDKETLIELHDYRISVYIFIERLMQQHLLKTSELMTLPQK